MSERVGYGICGSDEEDRTGRREILLSPNVREDRNHLDHGLTGAIRDRPDLPRTLAAVRADGTLAFPKPHRPARSAADARYSGDALTARSSQELPPCGAQNHHPADPMGKTLFDLPATFADFAADLLRMRTRAGASRATAHRPLEPHRETSAPSISGGQ
ncbi:recombinase family protein [Streptomyces sp. NPDC057939]|uniref:recombinase family protein n=1 Tax=Streptomyces sp. NPDC057939 TaxID=3346284 RepID=UPI0036E0C5A2